LQCKKGLTTGLKLLAVLTRKTAAEKLKFNGKIGISGIFKKYRELKSFCPKIFLINVKKVD